MKRTKVAIAITLPGKSNSKTEIDGYTDASFPGLAVHQHVHNYNCTGEWRKTPNRWIISHIPTGYSVCKPDHGYPTRKQAEAYARALCECADWTKSDPLTQIRGQGQQVIKHAQAAAKAAA